MRMFVGSPDGCVLSSFDCRRLTVMPGKRCNASDADLSGKAPMSVAVIESTKVLASFLMFLRSRDGLFHADHDDFLRRRR